MSNLIKSSNVISLEELKRLEQSRVFSAMLQTAAAGEPGEEEIDADTRSMQTRILEDAEHTAEQLIATAREEAARIRQEAERETEDWWHARRADDETIREREVRTGYDEGFQQGLEQAEAQVYRQMEQMLGEANAVVRQAYEAKEGIIAEAEHFVVDLSCRIAAKITNKQMSESPSIALELLAGALSRRKEQGVITLCVAPEHFAFVQAAKDDLTLAIDSQAELHILPDPAVKDGGCVIRSAFGSIDARIDTQLNAIREELLQVAAHGYEEASADDTEA